MIFSNPNLTFVIPISYRKKEKEEYSIKLVRDHFTCEFVIDIGTVLVPLISILNFILFIPNKKITHPIDGGIHKKKILL